MQVVHSAKWLTTNRLSANRPVTIITNRWPSYPVVCYKIFRVALVGIEHNKDGWSVQTVHARIVQVSVRHRGIDGWWPNVVALSDCRPADDNTGQKHPAVAPPGARRRVLVAESSVACEVRAAAVDDIVCSATDAPVKVLAENRLDRVLVLCAVKQLSLNQRRRAKMTGATLDLSSFTTIHHKKTITWWKRTTEIFTVKSLKLNI